MKRFIPLLLLTFLFINCTKDPVIFTLSVTVTPDGSGTVSTTSGSFKEGSEVVITATPSAEYLFKNWSGSTSSNDATIKIVMNSNKVITANFEKKKYPLSIKIEGQGTVTEVVKVQGRTTEYNSGTVVELTATPSAGWLFKEWQGDLTGKENPTTIIINKSKSVVAVFEKKCLLQKDFGFNYLNTSYKTRINYLHADYTNTIDKVGGWHGPLEAVVLDYNLDGYLDFVHTNSNYRASWEGDVIRARKKIMFYLGDCFGNLSIDTSLSNKFNGLIHGRKGLVGDFNADGYPDIFFAGHGTDSPPYSMEYPILLMNNKGINFIETRFTQLIGFWHSATSGDYDNDGDIDIILVHPGGKNYILNNQSNANFTIKTGLIPSPKTTGGFTTELFDIDKDGFLDLIKSGHDYIQHVGWDSPSIIFYGNGVDFLGRFQTLPSLFGWGIAPDIDFFDINSDGEFEIIMNRTGDPLNGLGFYTGWRVQILEKVGGKYEDRTDKFISDYSGSSGGWMYWLHITDKNNDGVVELFNDDLDSNKEHLYREWKLINGKFIRSR